jgi:hypothetical protein
MSQDDPISFRSGSMRLASAQMLLDSFDIIARRNYEVMATLEEMNTKVEEVIRATGVLEAAVNMLVSELKKASGFVHPTSLDATVANLDALKGKLDAISGAAGEVPPLPTGHA